MMFFLCNCFFLHLYYKQDLNSKYPDVLVNPVAEGMVEFEWDLYIDAKRKVIYATFGNMKNALVWAIFIYSAKIKVPIVHFYPDT